MIAETGSQPADRDLAQLLGRNDVGAIGVERPAYQVIIAHDVLWTALDQVRRALEEQSGEMSEKRARGIYRHYQIVARAVLRHHASEDKLIWPTLIDRVPDTEPAVRLILRHERDLHGALVPLQPLWNAWMSRPDAAHAEPLIQQLDLACTRLRHGFEEEERLLLAALDTSLSDEEWLAFGRDGAKDSPTGELMVTAGLMYQQLSRAEVDAFAGHARALFWFFRWVAGPYYRRYAAALHLPEARRRPHAVPRRASKAVLHQ